MYIGVDGGGTKTIVALANERGDIVSRITGGPSSPRNTGVDLAIETIYNLIKEIKKGEIVSSFIALPSMEEEFASKKEVIEKKLKEKGLEGKIKVGSDQLSAFRSATKEKDGIVLISGTGSVAHGWKEGRESVVGGWGYMADEGSAFYLGVEGFRAVCKDIDGRGEKTKIKEIVFKEWEISSKEELMRKIYSDTQKFIPSISLFIDQASKQEDPTAKEILKRGGEEIVFCAKKVIEDLSFKDDFPIVLSGSVFSSFLLRSVVESGLPSTARVLFVDDPVKGAVNLAREEDI